MALIWEEKIKISGTSQQGNMKEEREEISLARSLALPLADTDAFAHNIVSYNKPITCH